MVMTAGAARERLEKSSTETEQQPDAETEPFFPEERVRINASSAQTSSSTPSGANYHRRRPNFDYTSDEFYDREDRVEGSRFQKISLASHSSRESSTTSPKSLVFRTRF